MEKHVEASILLQIYGKLLTEKQYESIDILLGDKTANDTEKSTKLVDVF